ncbi:hypothetical protein [Aquamicrobium zhengzhouense]|uniref:Uncharacterized protein n=1 Tax=Aquamicrobium zhengzhouense TaxID=2781738 RepID=A0ABS0SFJ2_9HYPH|nr:hypothetical protein [Aquamicrobium zhengzhouense]MBI1621476.1 hypothetical protein [Aquamicrobium zhengzhouense]
MNHLAVIETASLPSLVQQAARQLASATTAAEVLDAHDTASIVYDAAKKAARMAKAKGAHDELVAAAHRAQADALEIEAMAKRRLADEYDGAVERGELAGHGGARNFKVADPDLEKPTIGDVGLSKQELSEARQFRDAEVAQPGIARRALDARLAQGLEPNKAALRKAVVDAAKRAENDASRDRTREALSPEVQAMQQAKAEAIAARKAQPVDVEALRAEIEELREANAALETDVARLTAENKLYGEMKVQFAQGGFDKVIAGKDAEISALESRLYRESEDKASWMKSAKYWNAQAIKHGYSRNTEIDLQTLEIVNG